MTTHPRIKKYTKPYKAYQSQFNDLTDQTNQTNQTNSINQSDWLVRCYDCLSNHNIDIYLLCGTCLGAIRAGAIIDHDPDADIGVMMHQFKAVYNAIPALLATGFFIKHTKKWTLTLGIPNSSFHIDIMVIKKLYNPILYCLGYRWFFDQTLYRTDFISARVTYHFLGRRFLIPSPVDNYLTQLYGPTWQTPQKNRSSGVLPLFSQIMYWPFVTFHLKPQHCGAPWTMTWKPWAYTLLRRYCPDQSLIRQALPPQ